MAQRATAFSDIACADGRGVVASTMAEATRSGYWVAHSSACIPPMLPPSTQKSLSMPSRSIRSAWAFTMSRTVMTGKVRLYLFPVFGLVEVGPVEPKQEPMTLVQMTK